MKFIFNGTHEYIPTKVTVEGEAITLSDTISLFEDFLRGMGYHVEMGSLQIVKDEVDYSSNDQISFSFDGEE